MTILTLYSLNGIGQSHTAVKGRIVPMNYFYEYPDSFIPFDDSRKNECNPNPLSIQQTGVNEISISMVLADCFTSTQFQFTLDSNLNITSAKFYSFSDAINQNLNRTDSVENLNLYFNQNPFRDSMGMIGRFSCLIKTTYLEKTQFQPFHGKFKFYSKSDLRLGLDELRLKMERQKGIVEEDGLYELPEFDAEYCLGKDSLEALLKSVVRNHHAAEETQIKVFFEIVLERSGSVESIHIESNPKLEVDEFDQIRKDLMSSCWIPAINYGKAVKSKIYPWIEIK